MRVSSGCTQGADQLLAYDDPARNAVGPAQQGLGQGEVGALQGLPDARTADPLSGDDEGLGGGHLKAVAPSCPAQHVDVAAAIATKAQVVPHDDVANAQDRKSVVEGKRGEKEGGRLE